MKLFKINSIEDEDFFDRQNRIGWWSQKRLSHTKIMVVGAGAIGNEVLKNLALLGAGNILIIDFDTISPSNLSRTVLFRKSDVGKRKAEVAANRTKELCLADDAVVNAFHGDIVWELGTGVYRNVDIVLGCLDNLEARLAVNRQCWLTGTPWIDAGIFELGCRVETYVPPNLPCYECSLDSTRVSRARQRYSCDNFKKKMFSQGKLPTVQIAASIVAAIQVQEMMKLLCGQTIPSGKRVYYQGKNHEFDLIEMKPNPNCSAHLTLPVPIPLPLSRNATLRSFLHMTSKSEYSGENSRLDFRADRDFIVWVKCGICGEKLESLKPSFQMFDTDTTCESCKAKEIRQQNNNEVEKEVLREFSLTITPEKILDMELTAIGVPWMHQLCVLDSHDKVKYYELNQDMEFFSATPKGDC